MPLWNFQMALQKTMKTLLLSVLLTLPLLVRAVDKNVQIPVTQSRSMQYDALNRPTNVWYSNGFREIFKYDAVGNMVLHQSFGPAQITAMTNVVVLAGKETLISFGVKHNVLTVTNITVKAFSSDPLPLQFKLLGTNAPPVFGSGTNRTVLVHPAAGVVGKVTVALVASDGFVSTTNSFTVAVEAK